jgi:hypothetical protein
MKCEHFSGLTEKFPNPTRDIYHPENEEEK